MADWNKDALDALKEKLKESVIINIGLGDKLNKAAGGFMKRGEVHSVQSQGSNAEQMEKLIEILQGKTNADFKIFCRILRDSNWSAWADELEREARKFRSRSGTYSLNIYREVEVFGKTPTHICISYSYC